MRDHTRPPRRGQDPPAIRHLRLVSPTTPSAPKPRRRSAPPFSPDEELRLRAALRHARALFGSWRCLADAMRSPLATLEQAAAGRVRFTGDIAIRLARALGKPVESLYAAPTVAGRCSACGASRGAS